MSTPAKNCSTDTSSQNPTTDHQPDPELCELVERHLVVAASVANHYSGRGLPLEDLRQVAYLGLVKAARGFDERRGYDFLSYALPTIRGEIRRHFRDAGWSVRPPRRIQELQPRLWAAEAELTQELHRRPTPAELAASLDVDQEEVRESMRAEGCFSPSSLDAPTPDRDQGSLGERLGGEDPGFDRAEARLMIRSAVQTLDRRDRTILRLRFYEGLTQEQIGNEIGVTQMQVSRLLSRILKQLHVRLTEPELAKTA